MLPRIVFADSVDSVDAVEAVTAVGSGLGLGVGLLKAPSSVGEIPGMGSSLMGDMRRGPGVFALGLLVEARRRARCCCCCCCRTFNCRRRSLSTSSSSGETLPCGGWAVLSVGVWSAWGSAAGWSLQWRLSVSLMSISAASLSRWSGGCWVRGEVCETWDG